MGKEKKVKSVFKLNIPAGKASPAPPLGVALGQRGINIMEFCKKFNDLSKDLEKGVPIPTKILLYDDKTFEMFLRTPLTSFLILRSLGLEKGSSNPGKEIVAKISLTKLREIATQKQKDINALTLEGVEKVIAGSLKSMGIGVSND